MAKTNSPCLQSATDTPDLSTPCTLAASVARSGAGPFEDNDDRTWFVRRTTSSTAQSDIGSDDRTPKRRTVMYTHLLIFAAGAISMLTAQQQQLNIYTQGRNDSIPVAQVNTITFVKNVTERTMQVTLATGTKSYPTSSIDSMTVTPVGGPMVSLYKPEAGASYHIGDTLTVQWRINPLQGGTNVYFELSVDSGLDWLTLNNGPTDRVQYPGPFYVAETGTWKWKIPATFLGTSLASGTCNLQIVDYNSNRKFQSGTFAIAR